MTTPGVENASCEFNVDTLAPTYRLVMGIPGKSNAFAISRRLGLPEEIIDRAAARLDAENVRFEDVLTKLDQQRQEMEKDRAEARRLKLEMEQSAGKAREYRKQAGGGARQGGGEGPGGGPGHHPGGPRRQRPGPLRTEGAEKAPGPGLAAGERRTGGGPPPAQRGGAVHRRGRRRSRRPRPPPGRPGPGIRWSWYPWGPGPASCR